MKIIWVYFFALPPFMDSFRLFLFICLIIIIIVVSFTTFDADFLFLRRCTFAPFPLCVLDLF